MPCNRHRRETVIGDASVVHAELAQHVRLTLHLVAQKVEPLCALQGAHMSTRNKVVDGAQVGRAKLVQSCDIISLLGGTRSTALSCCASDTHIS